MFWFRQMFAKGPRGSAPKYGLGLAAAAFLLAACQPLPHPFQPEHKPLPATSPGPRTALVVDPLSGEPEEATRQLAELLASDLRDRGIAAMTESAAANRYRLQGAILAQRLDGDRLHLDVQWQVRDPEGREAGTIQQQHVVPADRWWVADRKILGALAADAASKIDGMLGGVTEILSPYSVKLLIVPVEGAPGDGRVSLTDALKASLLRRDLQLASAEQDGAFVVRGFVRVGQKTRDKERVDVAWILYDSQGREIGKVRLGDNLPKGRLDRRWGEVATLVAEGSADGILQLLEKKQKQGKSKTRK